MERDGKRDVQFDVCHDGFAGRLDLIEGPTGRRQRSAAERARIAAESLLPGARIAEVARRHGTTRWQVYYWRRQLQEGRLALPDSMASMPAFAPLMIEEASPPPRRPTRPSRVAPAKVEIVIDDMVVRTTVDVEQLSQLLRAVRASR